MVENKNREQNQNQQTVQEAREMLVVYTKNKMMMEQETTMWNHCGGVLEHADRTTAMTAAQEGDPIAAQVLVRYIAFLEAQL